MTTINRTRYIDIARGIAIICIILGHLGIGEINRIVFTFHVPIFFFITGYFINTKRTIKEFLTNKIKTLLIPYACTCLIIILLATAISFIQQGTGGALHSALEWLYASIYGAGDLYTEPFYVKPIGALWFLLASFWGSIFLRSILDIKKEYRILIVLALFAIGYWSSKELFWFPFSIQAGCCAVLFMYIGYLVRQSRNVISELSMEAKIVISFFASIIWLDFIKNFQSFWLVHCDIGRGSIDFFGSICACYIVLLISKGIEKRMGYLASILSYLGQYSLIVLSVHIIELNLVPWWKVSDFFIQMGISTNLANYMMIGVKLIVDISITVICSKSTIVKMLFGLRGK